MAVRGRPTPQVDKSGWPRFSDPAPPRDDVNPFVSDHRNHKPTLLPADEAWPWRGRWDAFFGRSAPLHVEIGSGNGFFLTDLAQRHPEWNILGIEIRYKRTVLATRKIVKAGLPHARVARYHAGYLDDLFLPGVLSGLYVNHPDPWPKGRHEKHRLISNWFLDDSARLLAPGATFRLKTDFKPHVDRMEEILAQRAQTDKPLPFRVTGRSDDVARTGAPWPDDILTNYQRKAMAIDAPVYAIEACRT